MPVSRFVVVGFLAPLAALALLGGEQASATWDNFNLPVLSLRPAPTLKPATPVVPVDVSARRLPSPSIQLALPTDPAGMSPRMGMGLDTGFSTGAIGDGREIPRFREKQFEALRSDWAAVDARRLETERAHDALWNRTFNAVFPEPVSIRMGKVDIGGGLPTAIRLRNPFALLNQVFFSVSF